MTRYTTGEVAKLCDVSVRTVQFYDEKGLLKPTDLTDGGRRLYSQADVQRMHTICFLKELGFSLKDISILLTDESPRSMLQFLIDEQKRSLEQQIEDEKARLERLLELEGGLRYINNPTIEAIGAIANIMDSKIKLRNMRIWMLFWGLLMDVGWVGGLIFGIVTGSWVWFAIGLPAAVIIGIVISRYYYTHAAYICPEDHTVFRTPFGQMFWAAHTPSMRKLACPTCGYKGYCLELYVPAGNPERNGGYLIWPKTDGAIGQSAASNESVPDACKHDVRTEEGDAR